MAETLRRCEAPQMNDMNVVLGHWQLDVKQVRERVYRAPTPRERERSGLQPGRGHLGLDREDVTANT